VRRAREGVRFIKSRGKRKLSKESLTAFPREIIGAFVRLPKVFKRSILTDFSATGSQEA